MDHTEWFKHVRSPETGRKLRFGPAMAIRTNAVDLPSVTALFADVSSRGLKRQRRWSPNTASTPTKVGNCCCAVSGRGSASAACVPPKFAALVWLPENGASMFELQH